MNRITKSQKKQIAEFSSNIAVAWFAAGVIGPVFIQPATIFDFVRSVVVVALVATSVFFGSSLYFRREN